MRLTDSFPHGPDSPHEAVIFFPFSPYSYYYQPRLGQRGRATSQQTLTQSGLIITNEQVVDWIRELLEHPFVCYGYEKVTDWLRQNKGLILNKKKVYRLMKQARLLPPKKQLANPPVALSKCVKCRRAALMKPFTGPPARFDIKIYWVKGVGWPGRRFGALSACDRYSHASTQSVFASAKYSSARCKSTVARLTERYPCRATRAGPRSE